jgi:DNA-binding NarL/FixJ family response regulator
LSIRVLLVEDMKATHELVSELMGFIGGFTVVGHCATEAAALQWVHDRPGACDLMILDLMLREGTGFSVLAGLGVHGAGAPDVVVFSDFASPAVVRKCRDNGALEAIPKADLRRLRVFLETYRGQLSKAA